MVRHEVTSGERHAIALLAWLLYGRHKLETVSAEEDASDSFLGLFGTLP